MYSSDMSSESNRYLSLGRGILYIIKENQLNLRINQVHFGRQQFVREWLRTEEIYVDFLCLEYFCYILTYLQPRGFIKHLSVLHVDYCYK